MADSDNMRELRAVMLEALRAMGRCGALASVVITRDGVTTHDTTLAGQPLADRPVETSRDAAVFCVAVNDHVHGFAREAQRLRDELMITSDTLRRGKRD